MIDPEGGKLWKTCEPLTREEVGTFLSGLPDEAIPLIVGNGYRTLYGIDDKNDIYVFFEHTLIPGYIYRVFKWNGSKFEELPLFRY